jgi:hypothetical protein
VVPAHPGLVAEVDVVDVQQQFGLALAAPDLRTTGRLIDKLPPTPGSSLSPAATGKVLFWLHPPPANAT